MLFAVGHALAPETGKYAGFGASEELKAHGNPDALKALGMSDIFRDAEWTAYEWTDKTCARYRAARHNYHDANYWKQIRERGKNENSTSR